jgi:hypothetical protein|tara:strand:+ start:87 stop:947 length:861 start_codon:yes stop_codon:yes gene_type:complete
MTKGLLLFALNNSEIDYIKQAVYCAKKSKEHLKLPVALVTDNITYLEETYPFYKKYIDQVILIGETSTTQIRTFLDGVYSEKKLPWNNHSRPDCYDLSPFDETIVIDVDYIICNDLLLNCFKLDTEFLIYKKPIDISGTVRSVQNFDRISDRSIDMWWATGFYFKKSPFMELYFNLVKHIKDNWSYYRLVYQIPNNNYRNDFAFSIAIHILRGFQNSDIWPYTMPGNLYMAYDTDMLDQINGNTLKFFTDYSNNGKYLGVNIQDLNIHVMNKFSLGRAIDKEFENE